MAEPPVCILDFEKLAFQTLSRNALDYYRSGANQEQTLKDNREAFKRYRLLPRCLRDVSKRDLSITVLGKRISMPVGVSPTAMQRMAHPDGECANARAAASMNTVFILSTIATSSIEEIAAAAPNGINWFQLYIYKDRKVTEQLVKRAEKVGFQALVLTVDAPWFGRRLADARNKFTLPPHLRMANFAEGDDKSNKVNTSEGGSGINEYVKSLFDQSVTWDDVKWLKSITKLPIVLKGILTAEDAKKGLETGAAAIFVSNHGGRQLDGAPASIDVLPEIVKAVGRQCEIYLDGGVTQGTDVFKALAMGANMVFIGRPMLWGLAYNGEEGAHTILQIMKDELEMAFVLAGCSTVADISSEMVQKECFYSRL